MEGNLLNMTEAVLEALKNTLLASAQPDKITAVKHRQMEDALIETIWDIQERGDAFKDLNELLSYAGTEKILVIKNGIAYLIAASLLSGGGSSSGAWVMKGAWDASTNIVPNNGDATIKAGYTYENGNHSSTTMHGPDGDVVHPWATLRALVDAPGNDLTDRSKWRLTY